MSPVSKTLLLDFGIMSMVLVLSQLIRSRVRILQTLYMPSAVIAGLLCLLFGKQAFDVLPFSLDDAGTPNMTTYPGFLVVFLFATLFMGKQKHERSPFKMIEHAGDTFFYNMASLVGQYGFALLFGLVVLTPLFPLLPEGFAIFLPAGFIGGYGTATAIGGVLEQNGWEGAMSIGYASATIGMLTAVFAGIVIVNIATRKGWTRAVHSAQKLPMSMRTGFIPARERQSVGAETVSPMAIDPLTWHIALVCSAGVLAFVLRDWIRGFGSTQFDVPVFGLALLIGASLQKMLNLIRVGTYVDQRLIQRIGSWVTDYLVAFGIASIKLHVVVRYAQPLILLSIFGFVFTIALMWFVGRRICKNFWFERSIAMYGWNTGSVATSVALLRIIDPDMKTPVLEDFGLAYIGISFVEIAIIALLPPLIVSGVLVGPTLVLVGSFLLCLILSRLLVGWFPYPADQVRPGEKEIVEASGADIR